MNGPLKMYYVKPFIGHDLIVDVPDSMYRIKSYHSPSRNGTTAIRDTNHVANGENLGTFDQVIQFLKVSILLVLHLDAFKALSRGQKKNIQEPPEMAALVLRQEHILNQLAELKKQMLTLKEALRVNPALITSTTFIERKHLKIEKVPDLVINVSPIHPPYYLQVLQSVWKDVHLKVRCHLHSSVSSLDENARQLMERLQSFRPKIISQVEINVRVIWKDVGSQTELIVSKVPILGEVNILRYLARVTWSLNYETMPNPSELDGVLDTCYLLVRSKTKTERAGLLQSLNKKLGKASWLCGRNEFTVADVAVFSALRQIPPQEINVNLTKWLQKCEASLCR